MLIKPFGNVIPEQIDPLTQSHTGIVVDNNDPEKLGRVKISIDMWDYLTTEQLDWVRPSPNLFLGASPNSTSHAIPEVGSEVRVTFPNGDERDPQYEAVELNEGNKCTLFDEDYPDTYGTKDSAGNFTMVNKKTKITVEKLASGTTIQHDADGTVSIFTEDDQTYIRLDADGTITLKGSKIVLAGTDEINLDASKINIRATGVLNLGGDIIQSTASTKNLVNGAQVSVGAASSVDLKAPSVVTQNFEILGAPGGQIFDMTSKETFSFTGGVLVSVDR